MDKFQNKYRIQSARLRNWDYGTAAMYFITICTQNRVRYFGEVRNGEMELSEIGQWAHAEWLRTFELRPDMNLFMGAFVVMPDHFHAIVGIGDNAFNEGKEAPIRRGSTLKPGESDATHRVWTDPEEDAMHRVSPLAAPGGPGPANQFGPQSKNLASIVRGFKSAVTMNARRAQVDFQWQARFHDSIIRDYRSFLIVSDYIRDNPANWEKKK
jgi:REP element-mobilizing transposase RayT